MKKLMKLAMILMLGTILLTGCGAKKKALAESVTVHVTALKGPTAMGMVDFMDKSEKGEITDNTYQFEIVSAVDEVTPKLVQGKTDIAAVPANLASVLYNNTNADVQVLAINTLGVIYIVESGDTISDISDLKARPFMPVERGQPQNMR